MNETPPSQETIEALAQADECLLLSTQERARLGQLLGMMDTFHATQDASVITEPEKEELRGLLRTIWNMKPGFHSESER